MQIQTQNLTDDTILVTLQGRLDVAGAQQIDLPLTAAMANKRGAVLDLQGVDFVASLGLRSILLAGKALKHRGGVLVLMAAQPAVAEVLRLAGFDTLFPLAADLDGAVALLPA